MASAAKCLRTPVKRFVHVPRRREPAGVLPAGDVDSGLLRLLPGHPAGSCTLADLAGPRSTRPGSIRPAPSGQAARTLGLDPSTVTRLTDRMVTAGHVTCGTDPRHRGVVTLTLTPSGRDLAAAADGRLAAARAGAAHGKAHACGTGNGDHRARPPGQGGRRRLRAHRPPPRTAMTPGPRFRKPGSRPAVPSAQRARTQARSGGDRASKGSGPRSVRSVRPRPWRTLRPRRSRPGRRTGLR